MPERRLRDLIRVLKPYGIEFVASGGKHPRFKRGSDTYPFPAHRGEHSLIDTKYIKACCRLYGVDYDAIMKEL